MKYLFCLLICISQPGMALSWQDWFYTRDERGLNAYNKQQYKKAAEQFNDPTWRGVANYRRGAYQQAIQDFNQHDPLSLYNRGNAHAHLGEYQQAIEAYEQALKLKPNFPDCAHNLELLKKLSKQNKQAANQKKQGQQKQNQKNKDQQKQQASNQKKNEQQKQQASNQKKNEQQKNKSQKENKQANQQMAKRKQEKDQSHKQWLRRIPDDPGGLLKNKIYREYYRRRQQS